MCRTDLRQCAKAQTMSLSDSWAISSFKYVEVHSTSSFDGGQKFVGQTRYRYLHVHYVKAVVFHQGKNFDQLK
jgi:hypothetical protein